jgi:hypothetical protein
MDVTFLVLVVIGGMGIWAFIEQRVEVAFKAAEPRQEMFQHQAGLVRQQAVLARDQTALAKTQDKWVEHRLDLVQQQHALHLFVDGYPWS